MSFAVEAPQQVRVAFAGRMEGSHITYQVYSRLLVLEVLRTV